MKQKVIRCLLGAWLALPGLMVVISIMAAPLTFTQILASATCKPDWSEFGFGTWTNTTGAPVNIKSIKGAFVGAAGLSGELAMWLYTGPRATPVVRYSFGQENYGNPIGSLPDSWTAPAGDAIVIAPNEVLTLAVNCGAGQLMGPAGFVYSGVVTFWWTP